MPWERTSFVFTTSPGKTADALRLGANEVVVSKNKEEMQNTPASFDFILDAVSADHDINAYLRLLKVDGTLTLVGAPENPLPVGAFDLLMGRRQICRLHNRRDSGNAGDALISARNMGS